MLEKIAALPQPDRAMGERLHGIIKANAPALSPKTWYGMPAYAKDGNVVCFFQSAQKFKTRYATLKDRRAREESGERLNFATGRRPSRIVVHRHECSPKQVGENRSAYGSPSGPPSL